MTSLNQNMYYYDIRRCIKMNIRCYTNETFTTPTAAPFEFACEYQQLCCLRSTWHIAVGKSRTTLECGTKWRPNLNLCCLYSLVTAGTASKDTTYVLLLTCLYTTALRGCRFFKSNICVCMRHWNKLYCAHTQTNQLLQFLCTCSSSINQKLMKLRLFYCILDII